MAKNVVTDRIKRFTAPLPPFNTLEEADLNHLVSKVSVSYREEGDTVFSEGDAGLPDFYCVRQGSVRIENKTGELLDLCDEGDVFAKPQMPNQEMQHCIAKPHRPMPLCCTCVLDSDSTKTIPADTFG